MRLSIFYLWLMGFILALLPTPVRTSAEPQHLPEAWANIAPGTKVYAEVIAAPDAVYRQLLPTDTPDLWLREENTLLFGKAINVSERHRFLDVEHVLRVTVTADGWGLIEPDGSHSPYIPDPTQYHPTYIDLNFLKPLNPDAFTPFNVYPNTQQVDKLIVIIRDARPKAVFYEGSVPVLMIPVVLGPSKPGDYRVYRTRVSDDMPGIPAVPFSNYFSGGFTIHDSPWWNWRETVHGHYGSHGCVNLPDKEWYQIQLGGESISIAQWVYRWVSTNIDYDENDPNVQEAQIRSGDPNWYQASGSVRVIITESMATLYNYPLPKRLGSIAAASTITDWRPLIDNYEALGGQWLLMNQIDTNASFVRQFLPSDQSIAQIEGNSDSVMWVMLDCAERETLDRIAYPGSSRTALEVCTHLITERQNSICTPERIDVYYFGQRVLCNASKFNLLNIEHRGALIEHERIHLIQFKGYFKDLYLAGVAIDDATPYAVTYDQLSTIGVTELMAQRNTPHRDYAEDYVFVLVRPTTSGGVVPIDRSATTQEAWEHLRRECGDPDLTDASVELLLVQGLMGDADAYQELERVCTMPPHRLIPDRWRLATNKATDDTEIIVPTE